MDINGLVSLNAREKKNEMTNGIYNQQAQTMKLT